MHLHKFDTPLYRDLLRKANYIPKNPPSYPTQLSLEITRRCNANCIYCARRIIDCTPCDLTLEGLEQRRTVIEAAKSISICGIGEPLLHPQFIPIMETLRSFNRNTILAFVTNGQTPCSEYLIRKLNELQISIVFSADTINKDLYEKLRVGCKMDRLIKNLKEVQRIKKKYRLAFPLVVISAVLLKETISSLLDTFRALSPYMDSFSIRELVEDYHDQHLYQTKLPDLTDVVEELKKESETAGIRIEGRPIDNIAPEVCLDPYITSFIFVDGSVTTCESGYIGNLNGRPFEEIWKANPFRKDSDLCRRCRANNTHNVWMYCT